MKIKKKKLIVRGFILMILGFIVYSFGYIPILGNIIANKKLSDYYTETKGKPYKIEAEYDWYNTQYKAINRDVTYSLQSNTIYDGYMSKEINDKAKSQYNKIKEEFPDNLTLPSGIDVFTRISAKDYSVKNQTLYLLGIYNTEDISEEESEKMPAIIGEKVIDLMGEDYNITGIQIIYYDKNGGYEGAVFKKRFKKLKYNDILHKTEKEERLPEVYFDWLANQ